MRKIFILGNTWHGNWSLSVYNQIKKSNELVEHIDVRIKNTKIKIPYISHLIKKTRTNRINNTLRGLIDSGSLVIAITPYNIYEETWKVLKERNVNLVAWLGDDPLKKGKTISSLKYFDKIYLVDETWVNETRTYNKNVFLLPHAFLEDKFFEIQNMKKDYQVTFVGDSFLGGSDGLLRAKILKTLVENNIEVALFGDKGWLEIHEPEMKFLSTIYKGQILNQENLNEVYNKSKIVLNIHHSQIKNGANQRIFEVSGSCSFQISDKQDLVTKLFGETIEMYSNTDELLSKVKYYLEMQQQAETKARGAQAIALDKHTYLDRVKTLLDI